MSQMAGSNSPMKLLNQLLERDRARLLDIAAAVNDPGAWTSPAGGPELIGRKPCKISMLSQDSRHRAQKQIRFAGARVNFRPWHIAWIARYQQPIPLGLQYSHRCHNENCIEPTHGRWEDDQTNKSRNGCKTASHVLVDGCTHRLCRHSRCCLVPRVLGPGIAGYRVAERKRKREQRDVEDALPTMWMAICYCKRIVQGAKSRPPPIHWTRGQRGLLVLRRKHERDAAKLFGKALKLQTTKRAHRKGHVARVMTSGIVTASGDVPMGDPQPSPAYKGEGPETR